MRRFHNLSIRTKYILILTLCIVVPLFLPGRWLLSRWVAQQEDMNWHSTLNQMKLTAESLDNQLNQISSVAYTLSGDPSVVRMLKGKSNMEAIMMAKRTIEASIDANDAIRCVQIFHDRTCILSIGIGTLQTGDEYQYYERLLTGETRRQWGPAHILKSFYHGAFDLENHLIPYYGMIYSDGRFSESGVLAVYVDEKAIQNGYRSAQSDTTQVIRLLAGDGSCLTYWNDEEPLAQMISSRDDSQDQTKQAAPDNEITEELPPEVQTEESGILRLGKWQDRKDYYWCRCAASGLILLKIEQGDNLMILQIAYLLLFVFFLVVFITGCTLLHSHFISRPIAKLSGEMEACIDESTDKLNPVTAYEKNDEIGKLTRASNHMIGRINGLIDTVYMEQIRAQQAKLDLIGAQINPHFLFNTIDSIHWTTLANGDLDVGEQLETLSDFLREMLNFGAEEITLEQELKIIHDYRYLLQKRYLGSMQIHEQVDPDLLDCRISKLLIQPLVENSFTHGLEKDLGSGEIWLFVRRRADKLQIIVMDNGKGCDGRQVRREMEGTEGKEYFALRNIRERLRLKYGEDGKLLFYSIPGKGTYVRLEQPIVRE